MSKTKLEVKSGAIAKKISLASEIFARLAKITVASEIFLIFLIFFKNRNTIINK